MSRPRQPTLLGWSAPSRRLLSIVALVLIGGLGTGARRSTPPEVPPPPPNLRVDPNTAPVGVLMALPKIGTVLAGRIAEARKTSPLRSVEEIDARVKGVGPVTAEAIRPFLDFGGRPDGEASPGDPP